MKTVIARGKKSDDYTEIGTNIWPCIELLDSFLSSLGRPQKKQQNKIAKARAREQNTDLLPHTQTLLQNLTHTCTCCASTRCPTTIFCRMWWRRCRTRPQLTEWRPRGGPLPLTTRNTALPPKSCVLCQHPDHRGEGGRPSEGVPKRIA